VSGANTTLTVIDNSTEFFPDANAINSITAKGASDNTDVFANTDGSGRQRLEYREATSVSSADIEMGRFDLQKGDMVVVDVNGNVPGSIDNLDTVLRVFNSTGALIAFNNGGGAGEDSEAVFAALTTGAHYIAVTGEGNATYNPLDGSGALAGDTGFFTVVLHLNPTSIGSSVAQTLNGTSGDDYIVLMAGNDVSAAGAGDDTVSGGDDNDTLTGETGNDYLFGDFGDDSLNGGVGDDVMGGGAGNDLYWVSSANDIVTEYSNEGVDTVRSLVSWVAGSHEENLYLLGTAANATGNNLVNFIYGNASNNILDGQGGADRLTGGGGDDTYIINSVGALIFETLAGAPGGLNDHVQSSATHTLSNNVELLTLTLGDNINGTGNALVNTITGNTGNNFIDGKEGSDTLIGGGGGDQFLFTTALGATNIDTIADFDPANDFVRLDDAIFTAIAPGFLAAAAFTIGGAAITAAQRIIYNSATGQVFYDSDGVGGVGQVQFALINTGLALTAGDIFVF
jgi:Ca2+-binding RTX toxin-like protein